MQLTQAGLRVLGLGVLFFSVQAQASAVFTTFDLSSYFRTALLQGTFSAGMPNASDLLGLSCDSEQGKQLPWMNDTVLNWKESTRDQYEARALVKGPITSIMVDRDSHTHFGINLNSDGTGDLEVIYNKSFGQLPRLEVGMTVTACGDYITVSKNARRPSPLGAIIHWVHYNPGDRDGGKHKHGYLIINKQPYGVSAQQKQKAQAYLGQRLR
jgi:hypothetical protein